MSIDLDKHRNALLGAFNDVISDKTKTDWALFGYEGHTNVLKVVGHGEDGLEEMAEDLNSSKIMYAVVRVTDPNTTRPKIVLINWQGEGAPNLRKGTCARHLSDLHRLLRGIHVTINARNEEEVEPEVVMAAVLKASATTYNFNERSEINDKTVPVGTNYKRTNPLAEINTKSRNQFWEEQEAEERKRRIEEQQRKDEELKQLERERKQREIEDAKHREVVTKERNARILAERKAEEEAAKRLASQDDKKWQQDLQSQYHEEQERAKRAEMMRMERKKEAESLIGHRTHSTRAIFECGSATSQKSDLSRPPPRKLKEFKPTNDSERVENNDTAAPVLPNRGVTARWPPANTTTNATAVNITAQKDVTSPSHIKGNVVSSVTSNFQNQTQTTPSASAVLNKQQAVPVTTYTPPQHSLSLQQQSGQSHSNGDVHSDVYDTVVLPSKSSNQSNLENDNVYDTTVCRASSSSDPTNNHEKDHDDSTIQSSSSPPAIGMVYEVDGMEYQILPEHGLCARALYDYQAADHTEITFDPEEIITNIEQIDAGWWQGVGPDGTYGLFPANYVELINQSAI